MANLAYFGPTTVLPEVTGQVVGFVRDGKRFPVNSWVQYINVDNPQFMYYELERDQSVRIVDDKLFVWEDGSYRPSGNHNLTRFKATDGRCMRRYYPWTLGEQAIEVNRKHGAVDPELVESKSCASQAMVNRTNRIVNLLETSANWNGSTATANSLNGGAGKWDTASDDPTDPNYLAINKSLMEAITRITLLTNGVVGINDLRLVLSPRAATKMSQTAEVHNYVKFGSDGRKIITETLGNPSVTWGMPSEIYGIPVVVETCVRVSTPPVADGTQVTIASGNRTFVKNDDTAFLVSRAGGLDGVYGSKSFSTVQCYFYKYEMAVEARNDGWNKLAEGGVVEQFQEVLAAPAAGFLITDILS
jgi:hypothetical protein